MNKTLLVMLAAAGASTLSGCGMFGDDGLLRNRSDDYQHARETPPITVPEELDASGVGQLYPIPEISETAVLEEYEGVPRPQPLSENTLEEVVKIQTLGDARWILSNRAPSEIWPRVRNILNRSGIPTDRAEAGEGIIETAWLEFEGDEEYNHRYRFYVQPGVQMGSTEIKLLHDQVDKERETKESWPEESADDSREEMMVEILANALAGDVSSGTVSLQAQSIGGERKVEFVTPRVADPYLLMNLDYDRAWASADYALERGGFTTIDQNQSEGVFYVNYTPLDEEEKGWFGRLFSGGDEKLSVNYRVKVAREEDGVQVRVVGSEGESVDRDEAIRLLKVVRANLS